MAIRITTVDGDEPVKLLAADGSFHVVDMTEETTNPCGLHHPCGAYNVTFLVEENIEHPTGLYAPNGSLNVVLNSSDSLYHPCGAYNVIWLNEPEE